MQSVREKIQLSKEIITDLELINGDCAFLFGSTVTGVEQIKLQQIRCYVQDRLTTVEFKKIEGFSDIDLRIISNNAPAVRRRVKGLVEKYANSPYLIEVKVDDYGYPLSDIKDTARTSFFRRVLMSDVIILFGQDEFSQLKRLARQYYTLEDDDYDRERKQVYQWARTALKAGREAKLDIDEARKKYPVYYSPEVLSNERQKRQVTPLQLLGNTKIDPWLEITTI